MIYKRVIKISSKKIKEDQQKDKTNQQTNKHIDIYSKVT